MGEDCVFVARVAAKFLEHGELTGVEDGGGGVVAGDDGGGEGVGGDFSLFLLAGGDGGVWATGLVNVEN